MSENIQEGLVERIQRAKEIRILWAAIGPAGTFGVLVLGEAIVRAERALGSGDVVEMIKSYNELENVK